MIRTTLGQTVTVMWIQDDDRFSFNHSVPVDQKFIITINIMLASVSFVILSPIFAGRFPVRDR